MHLQEDYNKRQDQGIELNLRNRMKAVELERQVERVEPMEETGKRT